MIATLISLNVESPGRIDLNQPFCSETVHNCLETIGRAERFKLL